ncbi:MAG: tetratricopeptide repeat protein [Myxococcota bacterium]
MKRSPLFSRLLLSLTLSSLLSLSAPHVEAAPSPAQAAMNETLANIEARRFPEAIVSVKKALAAEPERVEAHLLYIRLMLDTGKRSEVQAEYAKRRDTRKDGLSLILYGRTLEDPAQMEAAFKEALAKEPKLGWAHYCLATLRMQQKKPEQAVASLEAAVGVQPGFYQALESLGTLYVMQGKTDLAIQRYKQAVLYNPENAQTLYQLGSLQGKSGDLVNGVASLEKARTLAPGNPMVLNNLAFLYFKQKRYDESLAVYDEVLKALPEASEARLNREVVARVKRGDLKFEAVAAMEKAMSASKPEDAVASYKKVIALSPNFELPYLALGQLYAALNNVEEAEKSFVKALQLNPNFPEGARLAAEFYLVAGKPQKAEAPLVKAIQASPKEPQLYAALGMVYLRTNQPEKAETSYNTAIKLMPANLAVPSRLNRSRAIFAQGRFNEALKENLEILKLVPNYPDAKLEVGHCYFALEKFDDAKKQYQAVLALDPKNPTLQELVKAVDARKTEFATKSKDHLRARQILVKTRTEADDVLKQLQAGGDFVVLARKKSISPEAPTGGDLGFFKKGDLMPELEKAVLAVQPGQLSEVVQSASGFHILKRLN